MKGTILKFDKSSHSGLISGHDGERYKFVTQDLVTTSIKIREGMEVDFNAEKDKATEIYIVKQSLLGSKQKSTAMLLAFFLGGFGAHHFYLGNSMGGVMSLLFFWTFIPAIISFINLVQLMCMNTDAFNDKFNG